MVERCRVSSESKKQDKLSWEKKHFIEDVGLVFEEAGLPRMAGRVLGQLLICVPPHQTADELGSALHASKGSISTTLRMLTQSGLVERFGMPGERRMFFRIKPGAWAEHMRRQMSQMTYLRELTERGLSLMATESPEHRQRLKEFRDLYAFFEKEAPALLERYERTRQGDK
jgi:DNA-binding transcriptional regulator GbsR (MarR family)